MLASNYIPAGTNVNLQSENGLLGLVSSQSVNYPTCLLKNLKCVCSGVCLCYVHVVLVFAFVCVCMRVCAWEWLSQKLRPVKNSRVAGLWLVRVRIG